ncbi:hypothetical protein [Membranihabitans marinus]|uniref:hypothetical protein n=1 Tax=Membranihabitans marinus TaxID=1227546 RepID=UPI001F2088D1|nr:hypothetical protein [Membranihabitans marinus]
MKNVVKNIHRFEGLLSDEAYKSLIANANQYNSQSNISFKVLDVDAVDRFLLIEVRQGKNANGQYCDVKELIDKTQSLFSETFPKYRIICRPKIYHKPPVDEVTPKWLQETMTKKRISSKQIRELTGIDKSNISSWINGGRPMSQPVKSMFYFMFKEL